MIKTAVLPAAPTVASWQCAICQTPVQEAATLAVSRVQHFYLSQSRIYDWTRWLFLFGRRKAVARLGLRPDSRVLEVGCGTGLNFDLLLRELDPVRGRLIGMDFSAAMLDRARRRVLKRGWPNVRVVQGDAEAVPIAGSFDAVLYAYSLAMIPDWKRSIESAVGQLAPGGRLVVLEFGAFESWRPMSPAIRWWLRRFNVETARAYEDVMRTLLEDVTVECRLGGWYVIASGRRKK